jgi:xanthine/CO dehydrogenase XdhC/CoxF family maturation factor
MRQEQLHFRRSAAGSQRTGAARGAGVALATVIETWGSAPRPVGSHLVIDADGNFMGSVSGGCVEGAVIAEAAEVIETGKPRMLEFGVADETAWQVGPELRRQDRSCGAGRLKLDLLAAQCRAGGARAAILLTDLETGAQRLVGEGDDGRTRVLCRPDPRGAQPRHRGGRTARVRDGTRAPGQAGARSARCTSRRRWRRWRVSRSITTLRSSIRAPRLPPRRAFPIRADRRMARRGLAAGRARPLDRVLRADPRSQDRRSGADCRA